MVSLTDRLTKLQDEIAAMQPKLQVGFRDLTYVCLVCVCVCVCVCARVCPCVQIKGRGKPYSFKQ
jgi:hypothetical protein